MKKEFIISFFILLVSCGNPVENSQGKEETGKKNDTLEKVSLAPSNYSIPDLSPMDMVYFPVDYPLLKMTGETSAPPLARIIYSRPQKQGRKIFGQLIKYNVPWRLGANEATEIEFFSRVTIQNKTIEPGRYLLYCIPQPTIWKLVLNSNLYSWGLQQNRQKDIMEFEAPVEKNNTTIEYFTIAFEKNSGNSTKLIFLWDDVKVSLPLTF
jgi:hypothetical protein